MTGEIYPLLTGSFSPKTWRMRFQSNRPDAALSVDKTDSRTLAVARSVPISMFRRRPGTKGGPGPRWLALAKLVMAASKK